MDDDAYYVARAGDLYRVFPKQGCAATVLEHQPMEKDLADFLCAHMNRAYQDGLKIGDTLRRDAIRDALGL